ncbi:GNAT family N-acetyltransferase [Saccharomonospora sp. NPDC006951]
MDIVDITREHEKRLCAADALLPRAITTGAAPPDRTVTTRDGVGFATRSEVSPGSGAALWRALVEERLDVRVAGDDPGAAMDALLTEWDSVLGSGGAGEPESEAERVAVVPMASRDPVGAATLLRHRFAPMRVLAVRPADRLGSGPAEVPGVRIRHAEPEDLTTLVRLHSQLRRFDAGSGLVPLRDGEQELLGAEFAESLSAAETPELQAQPPALWIAELYGKPLGYVHVQLPPATAWIQGQVAAERVGYLASLHVAEEARSAGVGSALAAHAHQLFDEEGVEAVLLHHALANPRSTPFWYAQGYRPLWTYWYRRPAETC